MHFSWGFIFSPHRLPFDRRVHVAAFSLLLLYTAHASGSGHSSSTVPSEYETAPAAEAEYENTTYDGKGDSEREAGAVQTTAIASTV